jgi:hypothetical protein
MTWKSWDERLQETLDYVESHVPDSLEELQAKLVELPVGERKTVSGLMHLGESNEQGKQGRKAKRALILATYVFLKNTAARDTEIVRVKALSSLNEPNLLVEYRSWFARGAVTGKEVADHAVQTMSQMPKWNNLQIKSSRAVRGRFDQDHEFNCYNGVVFWAFQAGAISRRFLWNYREGKDGNMAFPVFSKCGWITEMEYLATPGTPTKVFDNSNGGEFMIDAGLAVYYETPTKLFGHVALSLGGGRIISQNAVAPDKPELIKGEYALALEQMRSARTHIISIRNFIDIHYYPKNSYFKLKRTVNPFWEAYPLQER